MNRTMMALHDKYGPLVRTGPDEVSVSDVAAIKQIYRAGTKFQKSDWYSVWQGHRKFDLFAERNERLHGEQRRLVSSAYSMEALKDLEPFVDKAIDVFMECMKSREGKVIDMGNWVQLFAFGKWSAVRVELPDAERPRCHRRSIVQQTLRVHGGRKGRWNVQTDRRCS